MLKQAQWIKDWCRDNGFNFVDTDTEGVKLPCALDRGYKENNNTIFIEGFSTESKRVGISYGGLKTITTLRVPIDKVPRTHIEKWIPSNYMCAKCKKKNLNLRTQDNHKTYDCPKCQVSPNSSNRLKPVVSSGHGL